MAIHSDIAPGLSYGEYEARDGLRGSLLAYVHCHSLKRVKAMMDGKTNEESRDRAFGTAFHSLALENQRVFVERPETYPAPKGSEAVKKGRCKAGDPIPWHGASKWCKDWLKEHEAITVLQAHEVKSLEGMAAAVHDHPEIIPHLSGARELSIFVNNEGTELKTRLDIVTKTRIIIDLKKCRSARPASFLSDACRHGYHVKAGFNVDVARMAGMKIDQFWLVGVEEFYPHDVCIIKMQNMPSTLLSVGRMQWKAAYQKLNSAITSGKWPSHPSHHAEEDDILPYYLRKLVENAP